ncbi:hypothetical protein CONCODRAFT_80688 [Conidiobolus coronatus NRRL 28638]|uniref:Uncharacterized protein n=1 Tax=Conidiobolus coronatus (strain ATCC 28846 / CBS 209.66 / NRRL 28638) TaxID=796925 RepID=A0A137NSP3_CONC2|nr:hypothetical protein CONCODRAFT_80688 [Conidiobolus coronatus NRRL 28638]|eukprot:KXN65778.1 hypothetical protein CONCODRAFT_80688 [Conidiobolus coronatus NRRL 28638]
MSTGKGSSSSGSKSSSSSKASSNTGKSSSSSSTNKSGSTNKSPDIPNTPPPPYTPIGNSNSNVPNTAPPPYSPTDPNKPNSPSNSNNTPPYNPGSGSNIPITSGSSNNYGTSRNYIPIGGTYGNNYGNNYNRYPANNSNTGGGLSLGGKIAIGVVFGSLGLVILLFIAYKIYKNWASNRVRGIGSSRDIETGPSGEFMEQRSLPLSHAGTTILNSEDCRIESEYMEQNQVNSPLLYNTKL